MRLDGKQLNLSASDLANHLACKHLTELDRAVAHGRLAAPSGYDPALALLHERGFAHEQGYVDQLRARGLSIVESREDDGETAVERTARAMREGVGAIVQAGLRDGRWSGRADVLLRVAESSNLGEWSYEVVDTKLAQETRAGTVLQLCLYSEMVGRIQGHVPSRMHVVKPGDGFPQETFPFADYQAYYRLVRRSLEGVVSGPPLEGTYPDPIQHCEICRWSSECDARRHQDDHLSLVAGIHSLHIGELERQGILTLEQFAEEEAPVRQRPERGNLEAFARAQAQARIQLAGRKAGRPVHELIPAQPGLGLSRLPEPVAGDVFFDIESDPFVAGGDLEYLLGVAFAGADGVLQYRAFWGLDRSGERRAFDDFIDFVMDRWRKHPGMHVYHFSPYEPAAVKRLIGRLGIREADVDRLLRAERFVDLLAATRHGLRASVESYSLKELERFFGFRRAVALPVAGAALRRVAWALEFGVPGELQSADRDIVAGYNRDDCLATAALQRWLEETRVDHEAQGAAIARPEVKSGDASESVEEQAAEIKEVYDRLVAGLPEDRSAWGPVDRARWLLAHLLEYFRREDRCAWWEYHRLRVLNPVDLLEERKAVSELEFVGVVDGGTVKCPIHRYRFPMQEAAVGETDALHEAGTGNPVGSVSAIDQVGRTLDIRKRKDAADLHPAGVFLNERVGPSPVDEALLRFARSVADHGADGTGPFRADRDLLLNAEPRLTNAQQGPLLAPDEDAVEVAKGLVRRMAHGVLPIQGPPGTGKTYTAARMIVDLANSGKRVGVTAVSHKVIRNLLEEVGRAAAENRVAIRLVHKPKKRSENPHPGIEEVTGADHARASLDSGAVVGGTTWLWSSDIMSESADYLFIDEAGQMSLAHALGASVGARNLVLIGDPQQLEQPQRGAHPEGADVAALVHILEGRQTILPEKGLFLGETMRLCPRICEFTSEVYYEGKLRSRAGLERQVLAGDTPFAGSGLFYVPVQHEGNQNSSPEEVEAVVRIVGALLGRGVTWIEKDGPAKALENNHILVVAPYNAQVGALEERLPAGVRVGTVDKFQGQGAAVVIYSMASSSAEDAPRGMGFLYNPNRLNVATSRARCACILVAAPRLLEPECRTPEQMRWANGLCRFRELATEWSGI